MTPTSNPTPSRSRMTTQTQKSAVPLDGHAAKAQAAGLVAEPSSLAKATDLAEIIGAYNQATDKLRHSHEALQDEIIRLRKELASADAQLQRSKRLSALGEMAAGIAHEVRNPLAAIQLYASMIAQDLQATPGNDEPIRCAGEISAAVRGLDGIVGDVLSFARELKPNRVKLPVGEVFERAIEAHRPAIESAGVTIVGPDPTQADLSVYADADLLHRALLNLIRNAVDAMTDVPGRRVLTLNASVDEAGTRLSVTDVGPGVVAGTIDRLFNPFFTTRATGTGLGLAIVHRIVDAHGGAVSVSEQPGPSTGAVFELDFPGCLQAGNAVDRRSPVGASV